MNNFTVPNPYTTAIPTGTLTKVQLTQPQDVQIAWPNPSGGNKPLPKPVLGGFLGKLFG